MALLKDDSVFYSKDYLRQMAEDAYNSSLRSSKYVHHKPFAHIADFDRRDFDLDQHKREFQTEWVFGPETKAREPDKDGPSKIILSLKSQAEADQTKIAELEAELAAAKAEIRKLKLVNEAQF